MGLEAFFHTAGHEADGCFVSGRSRRIALNPYVVGPRAAAADAHALALADQTIVGGAGGDRGFRSRVVEFVGLPGRACLVGEPVADHTTHAIAQRRRRQRAAVEENEVGIERVAARLAGQKRREALPECGQVAGNGRVLDVGQAQLGQAAAAGLIGARRLPVRWERSRRE